MATGWLVSVVWFDDDDDDDVNYCDYGDNGDNDDSYCDIYTLQNTHTLKMQLTGVCLILQKTGVPKTLL